MDIQIFLDMGLEGREAQIYLAILEMGPSLASSVAKKTGIERSVVYKKIGELIGKGFASYHIRENRRYFQATNPKELLDLAKERGERMEELLPELLSLQKPQEEETTVSVFKGREGYKTVLNDMLRHTEERGEKIMYAIAYTAHAPEMLGVWYDTWTKRRVSAGIVRRYLVEKGKTERYGVKQPLTEIRLLPKDLQFPSAMVMYGRKTLIVYPQKRDFTGIVIDSEGITKSNRAFFEALWRKSKRFVTKRKKG